MSEEKNLEENINMGTALFYSLTGAAVGAVFGSLRHSGMELTLADVAIGSGAVGLGTFISAKMFRKKSISYSLQATAFTAFGMAVGKTIGYYLGMHR